MTDEIRRYQEGAEFPGTIGRTYRESTPAWLTMPQAPDGAPNVVVVLLDDVGFGQLGCFGGLGGRIRTPNIDRLASRGLRYNNFHVAPMCSPTRAALLTGRNPHSVGLGMLMEMAAGFPGYDGRLSKHTAMIPAILSENGYSTWAAGKWHLTPPNEVSPVGPMDRWPLRQGFDRFYGFMSALADQYRPSMWHDNHHVGYPIGGGDKPYHLTEDLVDRAIDWVATSHAVAPQRPFFQYLATGAMHQPHQVGREWSDRYRGTFADGWDAIREQTLQRQKELGIVPEDTILPPRNPGVPEWEDLTEHGRALVERQMEVFAGFLEHTDHQIGRYVDELDRRGLMDNTIFLVLSDNGASGEGGTFGERHHVPRFNGEPESIEDKFAAIDSWGGPDNCTNYATGWAMAGNTPNRWYKQFTHEGGTRSPLIVHWPSRVRAHGGIRSQFHHVADVVPTILESIGITIASHVRGYEQRPLEGTSMYYTFGGATAATMKTTQYFEMMGHRAIWAEGWKAVTAHMTTQAREIFLDGDVMPAHDGDFDSEAWELYHLDSDFSEARDLAAVHPDKLEELVRLWWSEAEKHRVLPLDDRFHERYRINRSTFGDRHEFVYYGPIRLPAFGSPNLRGVSHTITADVTVEEGVADGVIVSDGASTGGYALAVLDGHVTFAANYLGRDVQRLTLPERVMPGRWKITVEFDTGAPAADDRMRGGTYRLSLGDSTATMQVERFNWVRYDSTGEGIRVGCDVNGVLPEISPPGEFSGVIHEVRITRRQPVPVVDRRTEIENALSEQ
jgi:arylsulfatase